MNYFKNILYVSEASVEQDSAFRRALTLAENNQAELTVLDVTPQFTAAAGLRPGTISIDLQAAIAAEHRQVLESGGAIPRTHAHWVRYADGLDISGSDSCGNA